VAGEEHLRCVLWTSVSLCDVCGSVSFLTFAVFLERCCSQLAEFVRLLTEASYGFDRGVLRAWGLHDIVVGLVVAMCDGLWRMDTQLAQKAQLDAYTMGTQLDLSAGRPRLARLYSLEHQRRYVISQLMNLYATDCLI